MTEDVLKDAGNDNTQHKPVMVKEVLALLQPQAGGIYIDGTLGLGGHARALLQRIGRQGRLIAIDRDKSSLEVAKKNLEYYADQCVFFHDDFRNIDRCLQAAHIKQVDGILLDVGLSSFQLDDHGRGFSFQKEGPLDMRMNQDESMMAYDLVNSLSEHELSRIIKDFGQDIFHRRIAAAIVRKRAIAPIRTTQDLRDLIQKTVPGGWKRQKIHAATRTFQAFRIAVNGELEQIGIALDKSLELLRKGGRIAIISFHSLEDKIAKEKFRLFAKMGSAEILTKKPLRPTEAEAEENSRARSARLRGAKRI